MEWLVRVNRKSTISRTVAQSFEEKNLLGASFFFKRGQGDGGTASKFFTTIAHQLVIKQPQMVQSVKKAIDLDPKISDKTLAKQFEIIIKVIGTLMIWCRYTEVVKSKTTHHHYSPSL